MSSWRSSNSVNSIRSIKDIHLRKAQLLTDITKDTSKIQTMWTELTSKSSEGFTPSRRLTAAVTNGANIVDGLILGWKLYRKFGGKKNNSSSNNKKRFGLFGKKKKK